MRRWSVVIGIVLILIGVSALLQIRAWHRMDLPAPHPDRRWRLADIRVNRGGPGRVPREQVSIPLEGAKEASVTVHHGAGRLLIGGGLAAANDLLLAGTFGGGLDASRRREGDHLILDMRVKDRDVSHYIFPWTLGMGRASGLGLHPCHGHPVDPEPGDRGKREQAQPDGTAGPGASREDGSQLDHCRPARLGGTHPRDGGIRGRRRETACPPGSLRGHPGAKRAGRRSRGPGEVSPGRRGGDRSPDYDRAANRLEILVETGVGSVDIFCSIFALMRQRAALLLFLGLACGLLASCRVNLAEVPLLRLLERRSASSASLLRMGTCTSSTRRGRETRQSPGMRAPRRRPPSCTPP